MGRRSDCMHRHLASRPGKSAAQPRPSLGSTRSGVWGTGDGRPRRTQGARPAYLAALRDVKLGVQRLDTLEDPLLIEATCLLAECSNLIYAFMVSSGATAVAAGRAIIVTNPEACRT